MATIVHRIYYIHIRIVIIDLVNALTMTYKNCFSHAISHLLLGVT